MPRQSLMAMKVALGLRAQYMAIFALTAVMFTQVIGVAILSGEVKAVGATDFVTTWKTDNPGTSNANQISLPIIGVNYDVDWGDGNIQTGNTTNPDYVGGALTHTYASPGTYTVRVSGQYSRVRCSSQSDCQYKLLSVDQWGDNHWTTMEAAFAGTQNLQIVAPDVPDLSGVTSMHAMFISSNFNSSISNWDTSNVTDMSWMFLSAESFNQPLDNWDTSNVTDMSGMFWSTKAFNQPLNSWDVSSVTTMNDMFGRAAKFNQPLSNWDTSNVTDMSSMFRGDWPEGQAFNQDISTWNTSSVTTMAEMFSGNKVFNQPLNSWNTSSVTNLWGMFLEAISFNQPLDSWDTSHVTNMTGMFALSNFNQPLNSWNTSSVTNLSGMFQQAQFNQPLSSWNTSNVTNMQYMFLGNADFNQSLASWNVSQVASMDFMFTGEIYADYYPPAGLSADNYDKTLISWSQQNLQNNVTFDAGTSNYCTAGSARQSIIDNRGWTINDAGLKCTASIVTPPVVPGTIDPPGVETPPEIIPPEVASVTPPSDYTVPEMSKGTSLRNQPKYLSTQTNLLALVKRIPEPIAIGFPWILLMLALILVGAQYYQVQSESAGIKRMQASVDKQKRLVEEQNNFVALSTHYLHTPLTVMEGEISLMVKAGTITEAQATKLRATLAQLNAHAEAALAQEEQNKVE